MIFFQILKCYLHYGCEMEISRSQKKKIEEEYESFMNYQYNGKSKEERKKLGQFFTPPELSIRMLKKFDQPSSEDTITDPCMGSGNLLVAAIFVGFDPKNCFGIEIDKEIYDIAVKRLMSLGVPKENLINNDVLKCL